MNIDTTFYDRCIRTLEQAHKLVQTHAPETVEYEMFRSACVKEFEIILEQSGKLLQKCLKSYLHSTKAANRLTFKDIFRQAAQFDLIDIEQVERWLIYRDNRNNTAHDYGEAFANETLVLLGQFIIDAKALESVIRNCPHD